MTASAESVGSGWGLSEVDLFAGRIDGSVAPLLPTSYQNLAVEEALARFGPNGLEDLTRVTRFSNVQIAAWYSGSASPPLAVMLIAAHKLQTGERSPDEGRKHAVATAGGVALKTVGLVLDGGSIIPGVGGVFKAMGGLVNVAEYGVEAVDHKSQDTLFDAVARRIRGRYDVSYNNNPLDNTGPEERSLSAWLLAESLVQLCDRGQVIPGCESLADSIVVKLLDLHAQKIRISLPRKANDTRPPGIELLELCERLNRWVDTGTAVQHFVAGARAGRKDRAAKAVEALHVKRPTSEPSMTALIRMRAQAEKYNDTSFNSGPDLFELAKKYAEQYEIADVAGDPTGRLLDDLIEVWMVANDFRIAMPSDLRQRRPFVTVCEFIGTQYGIPVITRVIDQIPAIATGRATLGVQKLAHHMLFEQRPTFTGTSRAALEEALYSAAQLWYHQPTKQYYTTREYKQRQGKFGTYEETKYRLEPFSEMSGVKRSAGELMIRTYLYQATALGCAPGDQLDQARLWRLKKSLPKRRVDQRLILHELPPACARTFL